MKQKKPPLFIPLFCWIFPAWLIYVLLKDLPSSPIWERNLFVILFYFFFYLPLCLLVPVLCIGFIGSCIDLCLSNTINRLLGREHSNGPSSRPPNDPWSII